MNEFLVLHTAGQFLVRTELEINAAAEKIAERWGLDVEDIDHPTAQDIADNLGQWTELDSDI